MRNYPLPVVLAVTLALGLALFMALAPYLTVAAEAATPPAVLDEAQQKDLSRIEAYLNSMTTLKARFAQVSSNGAYAEGSFYLSRPGRMRIEYDPPTPILIVATGTFLVYHDSELDQTTHIGLDSTPAGLLVGENISFGPESGITIMGLERISGGLMLSLLPEDDSVGLISLIFTDNPLRLAKWAITDPQGVVTQISLLGEKTGVALDDELFVFDDGKGVGRLSED